MELKENTFPSRNSDSLSESGIRKYLDPSLSRLRFSVHQKIDSTNNALKPAAVDGEDEGLVCVAESQTAGKGRKGRTFFSPNGTGIYMSILLRPTFSALTASLLTAAAAAAVADSIEAIPGGEFFPGIKWVNDIFLDGKKVCGILTEASLSVENSGLQYMIVGIGINVVDPPGGFPEEIAPIVGSLFGKSTVPYDTRNRLIADILKRFMDYYAHLEERSFFEPYKNRLFFLGHNITLLTPYGRESAKALDITKDCHLVVMTEKNELKELDSGEISIFPY